MLVFSNDPGVLDRYGRWVFHHQWKEREWLY
ncbi:hypothetical protein DFR69_102159 [Nocardia neocaledoniensis]|uniref:Uncharacterized protein n=1 Tax=Nocardia neocaledoniensis TaxID=236511 RepID=A0A317NUV5_9NOCA|nr:hypothetical protein DFR69_102159 [Nocardia neocaledoniensis]